MRKNRAVVFLFIVTLLAACAAPALAEETKITGTVWVDKTLDGLFSDEKGLNGVTVFLEEKTEDGKIVEIAHAKTNRSGEYTLAVPHAGEYRLHMRLPSEYRFTIHGLDSAALPAKGSAGYTPFFRVKAGEMKQVNIGATRTQAYVTVMVFEDLNRNGGRASAEPRIPNVHIQLIYDYEGETYVVTEIVTPVGGRLTTGELSPGTYRARLILPKKYEVGPLGTTFSGWYNCFVPDEEGTGVTREFTLGAKDNQWIGAGMVRKAQ